MPKPLNSQFGQAAKQLRRARSLTQDGVAQAAQAAGFTLSRPAVSGLESGAIRWNTTYLEAYAAGLGLKSPDALLAATISEPN